MLITISTNFYNHCNKKYSFVTFGKLYGKETYRGYPILYVKTKIKSYNVTYFKRKLSLLSIEMNRVYKIIYEVVRRKYIIRKYRIRNYLGLKYKRQC